MNNWQLTMNYWPHTQMSPCWRGRIAEDLPPFTHSAKKMKGGEGDQRKKEWRRRSNMKHWSIRHVCGYTHTDNTCFIKILLKGQNSIIPTLIQKKRYQRVNGIERCNNIQHGSACMHMHVHESRFREKICFCFTLFYVWPLTFGERVCKKLFHGSKRVQKWFSYMAMAILPLLKNKIKDCLSTCSRPI